MEIIDAGEVYYRDLNKKIKNIIENGEKEIILNNVNGQRYIGDGIKNKVQITINGVPGNDLAAFAGGVEIKVNGNVQDVVANTMNSGKVVVDGNSGDILGYSMRGGAVYVRGRTGYRTGIHMKGFKEQQPTIIIGGTAGDFFGEYMAGGRLVLLGLVRRGEEELVGNYIGAGMHGGIMYIRGKIKNYKTGPEVKVQDLTEEDKNELKNILKDYCNEFDLKIKEILDSYFCKITPVSSRPYGDLYAY